MEPTSNLVDVSPPIAVDATLAGCRLSVSVGQFPGFILFPLDNCDLRLLSEDRLDWPMFKTQEGFPDPNAPRAHVSGGVAFPSGTSQLTVDALCFELSVDHDGRDTLGSPDPVVEAIGNWLSVFRSWLGLWTSLPQREVTRRRHPLTVTLRELNGQVVPGNFGGLTRTAYLGGLVTFEMITSAAAAASASRDVPEDRRMLARAAHTLGVGDYQASVIDSCTAAEISLSHWLGGEYMRRGDDPAVVKHRLYRANGILALFNLYFVINGSAWSFDQINTCLARPRNGAVHEGNLCDESQAQISLSTAIALVNELAPAPSPAEILMQNSAFG